MLYFLLPRKEIKNGICHSTQRPYKSKKQGCTEPYQAAACVFQHGGGCGRVEQQIIVPKDAVTAAK